jgi:hypothetical protein
MPLLSLILSQIVFSGAGRKKDGRAIFLPLPVCRKKSNNCATKKNIGKSSGSLCGVSFW